jgi:RNA polymerase sigma factor (sigma-70 family)
MASGQTMVALHTLRRVLADHQGPGTSDRDLLERFAARRDEAAFAELIRRHGPLVLHTCRRVLHDHHAAEDVFQATFLTLARRAGSRDWHDSVANWLYTVAYRLALKVRGDSARRLAREQQTAPRRSAPDPLAEVTGRELCAALDEELQRLPGRYRIPLVLCCLQGIARDEAAQQLGWSLGALKGRLQRGRELLHRRLARRGLCLSAGLATLALLPAAGRASLPPRLLAATQRLVQQESGAPPHILALAEGVRAGVSVGKLKLLAGMLLLCGVVSSVGWLSLSSPKAVPLEGASRTPPQASGADSRQPTTDRHGDPLPAGAVARLGTLRFRHGANINAVAFAPDGKTVASAGLDNVLRVWDSVTGKELAQFEDKSAPQSAAQLFCAAFSPDGKTLASGGNSRRVYLWDRVAGKQLHALPGHQRPPALWPSAEQGTRS